MPDIGGVQGRDGRRYWGTAELAGACAVTPQAVSNWVHRKRCPEPTAWLGAGPVWRETLELRRFIEEKQQ